VNGSSVVSSQAGSATINRPLGIRSCPAWQTSTITGPPGSRAYRVPARNSRSSRDGASGIGGRQGRWPTARPTVASHSPAASASSLGSGHSMSTSDDDSSGSMLATSDAQSPNPGTGHHSSSTGTRSRLTCSPPRSPAGRSCVSTCPCVENRQVRVHAASSNSCCYEVA
jgi:hypothetical protein